MSDQKVRPSLAPTVPLSARPEAPLGPTGARASKVAQELQHPGGAFPWTTISDTDLMVDGGEFYPRIFDAIDRAKSSVNIIEFGIRDNHQLKPFLPGEKREGMVHLGRMLEVHLLEARARGVPVRLIVDRYGSQVDGESAQMYRELERAGVQIVAQDTTEPFHRGKVTEGSALKRKLGNPTRGINAELGHSDHRKVFIIDGKEAFTGGMGFEDHFYDRMHDNMIAVHGSMVAQFQQMFLEDFAKHGGQLPEDRSSFFPPLPAGNIKAQLLLTSPSPHQHYRAVKKAYLEEINHAQSSIDIVNPYFYDQGIASALERAARRGVKVRLILPKHPERAVGKVLQHRLYARLQKAGVQIYEWPTLLHAKDATFDGKRCIIGSANLDAQSLSINHDAVIRFDDVGVTRKIDQQFFKPSFQKCGHPIRRYHPSFMDRVKFALEGWKRLYY